MGALTFPPAVPALVLFGRDQAGKPHASWFDAPSAELATKAAGLMSMRAVPVESDELRELVANLPRGRLFSSGRAFTPFVKGKLYERLVEVTRDMLGLESDTAANSNEPDADGSEAASQPSGAAQGEGTPEGDLEGPAEASEAAGTKPPAAASLPAPAKAAEPAPSAAKPVASTAIKPNPRPSRIEEIAPGSVVLATTGAAEGWFESRVIGTNGSTFTLKWVDYNEASFVRRGNELGFLPRLPS